MTDSTPHQPSVTTDYVRVQREGGFSLTGREVSLLKRFLSFVPKKRIEMDPPVDISEHHHPVAFDVRLG
jgi:hypothetical protein